MSVSEVMVLTKKFLREEAGFEVVKISSVVAIEGEANWKVMADIGQPTTEKKEIIVDDRDGKIISYKQA
jgi:ribosomal protein L21